MCRHSARAGLAFQTTPLAYQTGGEEGEVSKEDLHGSEHCGPIGDVVKLNKGEEADEDPRRDAGDGAGIAEDGVGEDDDIFGEDLAPAAPALQIHDAGAWRYRANDSGAEVGRLLPLGSNSLKAVCRHHGGRCQCAVSLPPPHSARADAVGFPVTLNDIERDLVKWLSSWTELSTVSF